MTLEEKFDTLIKNCEVIKATIEELKNNNAYLKYQLGDSMKQKRKALVSSRSSNSLSSAHAEESKKDSHPFASKRILKEDQEEEEGTNLTLMTLGLRSQSLKERLHPDEFLEWLHLMERVFDYKKILKDKKVKLVALRLRKYASL